MSGRPASADNWTHIDDIPVNAVQHSLGNTNHSLDYGFTPLYPFGFGLSYTTFEYSDIQLSSDTMTQNDEITVSATIKNSGNIAASEIVQLYTRDLVASYTRPVRELKAYKRLTIQPGESVKVDFTIDAQMLGFYLPDGNFTVEPGKFHVWIAPNAADGLQKDFELVE
jgi:beta-glucosidase